MGLNNNEIKASTMPVQDRLAEEKKSITNALLTIDESLTKVLEKVDKKITFSEFADIISNELDKVILSIEQNSGIKFVAGNCTFSVKGFIRKCVAEAEMYFVDANEEWSKAELSGALGVSRFTEESVSTDIKRLVERNGIKVEISHP